MSLVAAIAFGTLQFLTEWSPPNVMEDGGRLTGAAVHKVRAIAERAKVPFTMQVLPWARAYALAQTQPDTCVFQTVRNEAREALFRWVGPIGLTDMVAYGLAHQANPPRNLEEAKNLRFGSYVGDARVDFLRARGYTVDVASADAMNPTKLVLKRIDLWATGSYTADRLLTEQGLKDQILPLFVFHKEDLYLACQPGIDPAVLERLQKALEQLRKEGALRKIEERYR